MPELAMESLPADPLSWQPQDMWGWVNRVKPLVEARAALIGQEVPALAIVGGLRPVVMRYDRPSLVETEGYSWENHIADEMMEVDFLPDRIVLRVVENLPPVLIARVAPIAGMARLAEISQNTILLGRVAVSLGDSDWGGRCLSFASREESSFLVPDPYFFLTRGYQNEKREMSSAWIDWDARRSMLYWRGSPSGLQKYSNHTESQRVKLVLQSMTSANSEWYNVRFSSFDGIQPEVRDRVSELGGDGVPEPQMNILKYKYNADVDGWSCAWTGLFIKLLSGSPVLKVASDMGFRQWYYPMLRPWENFVPVASDLSDIEHVVSVLQARPDLARVIGEEGRRLAESLSFETQFEAAAIQMRKAVLAEAD